ncbi:MAG: alpha/beta fold hydrolase [Proteobacteria bacterium]|nr:alpha/beta fold hydrolase [Pseudomonadota bacterium]
MTAVEANGITIEYVEKGNSSDPAIILIRGLGTQLIDWPTGLMNGLADNGFRVVCLDNRDAGLSSKIESGGIPDVMGAVAKSMHGELIDAPYTLDDMALDVIGLQDALGISSAHVFGISMGGMIVQVLAAKHKDRIRSLISVMSSSGKPGLPQGKPEAMQALFESPPNPEDRESVIAHETETQLVYGSPGYPESEAVRRKIATARYDRCHYPAGQARQTVAVLASGSRVDLLKTISVPSLVIHGADDPLVPLEAGRDTAANIPGASLEIIEGMGHNIPDELAPRFVDLITQHARQADGA